MYFLELVKHEGKSLGWSAQNKRGFEPIGEFRIPGRPGSSERERG